MFGALLATSVLLNVHLLFSRKSCVATRSAAVELVGSASVAMHEANEQQHSQRRDARAVGYASGPILNKLNLLPN